MTDVFVGQLVKPFGIRGEMKLCPTVDFWTDVLRSTRLVLRRETADGFAERAIAFERYRSHGNCFVVRIEGVDDRNAAEELVGGEVFIDSEDLDIEPPDRLLPFQVVGATVKTEEGAILGEVTSVVFSAAHDVYEVEGENGTFLVPAVPEFVVSVDESARVVTIRPMPGLMDQ